MFKKLNVFFWLQIYRFPVIVRPGHISGEELRSIFFMLSLQSVQAVELEM